MSPTLNKITGALQASSKVAFPSSICSSMRGTTVPYYFRADEPIQCFFITLIDIHRSHAP